VERDLARAGLRVRHATFPALPDPIRFATRERASPLDLGPAARQALVALFSDGVGIAQALERTDSDPAAELQRILRELRTWPRLRLVDFSPAELDLPALAERRGLACITPDRLPAWLAERAPPRSAGQPPPPASDLDRRLWAAACALTGLPVTRVQARALYQALGLPPAWRLPAPAQGRAGADGIRFTDGERQSLLADLARWVWEDGRDSEATRCLGTALAFWEARLADGAAGLEQFARTTPGARDWAKGRADHEQTLERWLLGLWWGDARTAQAVRGLWDLHNLYEHSGQQALQPLRRLIRARLGALGARGLGRTEQDGHICLPWSWHRLPEAAGEPPGTARQRLLRMGFAGATPSGRHALGADTHLLLGAFAGIALAGLIGLGQRLAALDEATMTHDAAVYDGPLFQGQVMEKVQAGRLYAASRKLTVTRELLPGEPLRLHWCWSGLSVDQAPVPCRALLAKPDDPHRLNVLLMGKSILLRAGSLAEPIRACAKGWPDLSVAVIAAEPSAIPARRLAIRLLDKGAADLALLSPDWAEQARALADHWAFVANSQWLFFSPRPPKEGPGVGGIRDRIPELGTHRALLGGDLAAMARAIEFPGARPAAGALGATARVISLAGTPRLWGGPEVVPGPAGIEFVRVCPGGFTMGSHPPPPGMGQYDPARPDTDEYPAHAVLLDTFEIARTETTWGQLRALRPEAIDSPGKQGVAWPAANIDWGQARSACAALPGNGQSDLPSEAQWEYAARGGAQTPWSWGSDAERAGDYAWYSGNTNAFTNRPVGTRLFNPLGLYDMHGSLREWVRDCYAADAYADRGPHPVAAPQEDETGCGRRVLRGGSFLGEPGDLRSAGRVRSPPGLRDFGIGFRCVRGSGRPPNP